MSIGSQLPRLMIHLELTARSFEILVGAARMLKALVNSGAAVLLFIGIAIWVVVALRPDLLGAHYFTMADLQVAGTVFIVGGLLALWKALRTR